MRSYSGKLSVNRIKYQPIDKETDVSLAVNEFRESADHFDKIVFFRFAFRLTTFLDRFK